MLRKHLIYKRERQLLFFPHRFLYSNRHVHVFLNSFVRHTSVCLSALEKANKKKNHRIGAPHTLVRQHHTIATIISIKLPSFIYQKIKRDEQEKKLCVHESHR